MSIEIIPTRSNLVVQKLPTREKTDGGLFIPETADNPDVRGKIWTVQAVGPGVDEVGVGDRILLNTENLENSEQVEFKVEGDSHTYRVINTLDICARVKL